MKTTILALAAVAVVASLIAAVPLLHSSFAAQTPQTTTKQDSIQNQAGAVQKNNDKTNNDAAADQETNDDNGSQAADAVDPQLASRAKITADQAQSIALTHLSAAQTDVKSVSLDNENGHLVYSVEITKAGQSYDVKVDAINGQVANVDQGMDGETADGGQAKDVETNDDNSSTSDNHSDGEQADDGAKP